MGLGHRGGEQIDVSTRIVGMVRMVGVGVGVGVVAVMTWRERREGWNAGMSVMVCMGERVVGVGLWGLTVFNCSMAILK